jgi:AraC-like DNA-binding protein
LAGKTVFSSRDLSAALSDRAKFNLWQEIHNSTMWNMEYKASRELPFFADIARQTLGAITLGQTVASVAGSNRRASGIARDGSDAYVLVINRASQALQSSQHQRVHDLRQNAATLISAAEPFSMQGIEGATNQWMNIVVPARALQANLNHIGDRLGQMVGAENEALRHLIAYCGFLEQGPEIVSPELAAHASQTIVDLLCLAVGAEGEQAEIAGLRGLRAARVTAILARISAGFADHEISAQSVGRALGISTRYVHDLLAETGTGFAERVLELRLLRAHALLSDRRNGGRLISEIAMIAGFSDISNFNRLFRRRFGETPRQVR